METLTITYIKCDFCTAKNHCISCGEELSQALAEKPGIRSALVNLPDHTLTVTHALDEDALEDLLDGMGGPEGRGEPSSAGGGAGKAAERRGPAQSEWQSAVRLAVRGNV